MTAPDTAIRPESLEAGLRSVSAHEAGHHVVAERLGLEPRSFVAGPSSGVCVHRSGDGGKHVAAAGWAGAMAEDLLNARAQRRLRPLSVSPGELNRFNLWEWYREMSSAGLDEMSSSDVEAVQRFPVQGAAELALEILTAQAGELRWRADLLFHISRERYTEAAARGDRAAIEASISAFMREARLEAQAQQQAENAARLIELADNWLPTPGRWPAPTSEFLRLIAGGDGDVLAAYAGHLRARGTHADWLGDTIDSAPVWNYYARDFQGWLAIRRKRGASV